VNNRRDRSTLLKASHILRDELEARSQGGEFRPRRKLKAGRSYTDGWFVTLGTTSSAKLNLELWLDRYAGTETRRFYFGLHTSRPENMTFLINRLPSHLHPVRKIYDSDYEKVSPGVWLLKRHLRRREFNKPLYDDYEHYEEGRFYGVYASNEASNTRKLRRIVSHAADFFSEVMWLLPKRSKLTSNVLVYPQVERQVVRKHLVRERSSELAKACKRRDGFRCQVCKMTFAEVYGEDLGAEFAEAHHLKPLRRIRPNEKTRLEDLVTVCANCHRMLHLMRGREHDLEELKHIIAKRRRMN
jgi:5-methylcytosine-specific restriction endonuclease McrA